MPQKCYILPKSPKLFNPDNYVKMNDLMHSNVDSTRPRAFLNYVLFDKNMQVVGSFTGAWQAGGEGTWQPMGTGNNPMTIPINGYLAVYISNASTQADGGNSDVWFDHISIKISKGHLREEKHYYPYGLPMAGIGASDLRQNPNLRRYQSNEYIKALGLDWMSFGARQYDPQLGRFMSVDPLAAAGGQEMMSPYAAMGDDPVSTTDAVGQMPFGHLAIKPSVPPLLLAGSGFSVTNGEFISPGFHPHTGLAAIGSNIRFMEAVQLEEIEAALAVYNETTGESGEGEGSGMATNLTPQGKEEGTKGNGGNPQSGQQGSDKPSGGAIYVQRIWETEKSTISTFRTADEKIVGYILEPPGPSTTESGQDKRIPAGTYNLTPHVNKRLHSQWQLYNDDVPKSRYIWYNREMI